MKNKFFWIKLPIDFFDSDEIRVLKSFEDGHLQILVYIYIMVKSAKNDGFLKIGDKALDEKTLSILLGLEEGFIAKTISNLILLGLLKKEKKQAIQVVNIKEMIGSETHWAEYKRKERDSKMDNVKTKSNESPPHIEKEIDIDVEKELDKLYNSIR